MHWLQHKKTELILMDNFWKNEIVPSKKSKKIGPFFTVFPVFFFKLAHKTWLVFVELNLRNHDTSYKHSSNLRTWSVLKNNQEKLQKGQFFLDLFDIEDYFFQKWSIKTSSGFWRCNQCIKTLLLSYQTSISDYFHFSPF